MSAITKTIVGLGLTERVTATLSSLPVSGYMLLPGNNRADIWHSSRTISMQTRKPGYVLVDVEGLSDEKLIAIRDKARQYWVSGVILRGSSVARAVRVLQSENLVIGCTVSLHQEHTDCKQAMKEIAEAVSAGCTSLLIEPWTQGEALRQLLQEFAVTAQSPEVFYGIRPVVSASRLQQLERKGAFIPEYVKNAVKEVPEREVIKRTIEAEVKTLSKNAHVYVDGSELSESHIEHLMNELSITAKQ